MDPATALIISSLATGYFVGFTVPVVTSFFEKVFDLRPDLEESLKTDQSPKNIERIFSEAVGVIDAHAGTGAISVDQSFLEALKGVRFDHAHGTVSISGSTVSAPVLETGGSAGATGETNISGSSLKSAGTEINVGSNCSINMKGNAKIRQT